MKYVLLAFTILTVFGAIQHVAALDTGTAAENDCPRDYDYVQIQKNSSLSSYLIDVTYGPPEIKLGCDIEWIINFLNPRNQSEFLENVQYDIILDASVNNNDPHIIQSLASDEGGRFLYSSSGQAEKFMTVNHSINPTKYVILVYGLSPLDVKPSGFFETLEINVPFNEPTVPVKFVPEWIKKSASFWIQGHTGDIEFVSAMQYLVNEGIIVLPPTESGSDTDGGIPGWIKNTVGFWVDGHTTDAKFTSAIQYLVKQGIIVLS